MRLAAGERNETALDGSQVGAGPNEVVALRQHDPRPLGIEPQALLHGLRNFDRVIGPVGWRMCNRQDAHSGGPVLIDADQGEYKARTVLLPLLTSEAISRCQR